MGGEGRCAYEFANDALVDEDGDGEAEEAYDGEAAARPAEVELEVLAAGVPLLDPPVLVHFHPATHLLLPLAGSARRRRMESPMLRRRIWWCEWEWECDRAGPGATPLERLCWVFTDRPRSAALIFYFHLVNLELELKSPFPAILRPV